jgi:hypothetical protein
VRDAFGVGDNDYQASIAGALETPVFVQLDRHATEVGALRATARVESRDAVPDSAFVAFQWGKR